MFAMNRELRQNLDWFWYYWLFTTEAVRPVDREGECVGGAGRR